MSKRRIYVTTAGASWSLSPEAWRRLVDAKVAGKPWNLDKLGQRLSRKRGVWARQHHISRWCKEDWADELETLRGEGKEPYTCPLCGQRIDDGKPCGCGAR